MTKPIQPPPDTIDSEAAAEQTGISYPRLMRFLRNGYVKPQGYTGKPRSPAWWTDDDMHKAEIADMLLELRVDPADIPGVISKYWGFWSAGYLPMWAYEMRHPKTGKPYMGYIAVYHEDGARLTGKEKTIEANGEKGYQMQVYALPYEWTRKLVPLKKRRG